IGHEPNDFLPFDERQWRIIFSVGGMVRPHVVGVGEAEVFVETVPSREELRRIAQMPLAEDGRGVSARFEDLSDGHLLVADADLRVWTERAEQADAIRIA